MIDNLKPNLPPLLATKGSRGGYYVYTYQNQWDVDKKRSRRINSTLVGKIIGDQKEGIIEFSEKFKEQYPQLKNLITKKQGSKYIFTKKLSNLAAKIQPQYTIKHAGATLALNQLLHQSHIEHALKQSLLNIDAYKRLVSLLYFLILKPTDDLNVYAQLSESTVLPDNSLMTQEEIVKLLLAINKTIMHDFIFELNNVHEQYYEPKNGLNLVFDTALGTSTHNNEQDAKFLNKISHFDHFSINSLIVINTNSQLPLFVNIFNGFTSGINKLCKLISAQGDLHLNEKLIFVSDKGLESFNCIDECLSNKCGFIFKIDPRNSLIAEAIKKNLLQLKSCACYSYKLNLNLLSLDYIYCSKLNGTNTTLKIHLYFDKDSYDREYKLKVSYVGRAISNLNLADGKASLVSDFDIHMIKSYAKFTYDDKSDRYINCSINPQLIENALMNEALCVYITNSKELTADDCLDIYKQKLCFENSFNNLNACFANILKNSSSLELLEAIGFVQALASYLKLYLFNKINAYTKDDSTQYNYKLKPIGPFELLSSLNNIMAGIHADNCSIMPIDASKEALLRILDLNSSDLEAMLKQAL